MQRCTERRARRCPARSTTRCSTCSRASAETGTGRQAALSVDDLRQDRHDAGQPRRAVRRLRQRPGRAACGSATTTTRPIPACRAAACRRGCGATSCSAALGVGAEGRAAPVDPERMSIPTRSTIRPDDGDRRCGRCRSQGKIDGMGLNLRRRSRRQPRRRAARRRDDRASAATARRSARRPARSIDGTIRGDDPRDDGGPAVRSSRRAMTARLTPLGARRKARAMRFFSDNAAPVHPAVLAALADANTLDTAYDGDALDQAARRALLRPVRDRGRARCGCRSGTAANCLALAALCPPHGGDRLPPRRAHPERRRRRARILHPRRQAAARRRARREADAGDDRRGARRDRATTSTRSSRTRSRSPTRPNMAASIRPPRSPRSASSRKARGLRLHMDGARFANAVAHLGCAPADVTWRAGVDALSFGFVKNGGHERRGAGLLQARARRRDALSPQARRAAAVQGALSRGADPRDARGRSVARQCARRQCRRARCWPRRRATGWSIRSRRTRCSCASPPTEAASAARAGLRFLRLGAGRGAAGDRRGTSRPRRRSRAAGATRDRARCERAAATLAPQSTRLAILVPFGIVTLIWGSTWLVIRDQVGVVPPSWSVTLSLPRRRQRDDCARRWCGASGCGSMRAAGASRAAIGLAQFCLNFNFVYRAEEHITSGWSRWCSRCCCVPNAVFARHLPRPADRAAVARRIGGRDGGRRACCSCTRRGSSPRGPSAGADRHRLRRSRAVLPRVGRQRDAGDARPPSAIR